MMSDQENAALFLVHALMADSWGVQEAAFNVFGDTGFVPGLRFMLAVAEILRTDLPADAQDGLIDKSRTLLMLMRQAREDT